MLFDIKDIIYKIVKIKMILLMLLSLNNNIYAFSIGDKGMTSKTIRGMEKIKKITDIDKVNKNDDAILSEISAKNMDKMDVDGSYQVFKLKEISQDIEKNSIEDGIKKINSLLNNKTIDKNNALSNVKNKNIVQKNVISKKRNEIILDQTLKMTEEDKLIHNRNILSDFSIQNIIDIFDDKSTYIKKQHYQYHQFEKEKKGLEQNRLYKLDYRGSFYKEEEDESQDYISQNDEQQQEARFAIMNDYFYHETLYNFEEPTSYFDEDVKGIEEVRFGIQKTLNDFVYSQNDYERDYIKAKENYVKNNLKFEYLNKVDEIIEIYKEILMLDLNIKTDQDTREEYEKLYKVAKLKKNVGRGLALEVEYLKAEIEELTAKIKYYKSLKKIRLDHLAKEIGIKEKRIPIHSKFALFNQNMKTKIKINDYDLRTMYDQIELKQAELKLKKREEQDEITVKSDYDVKREVWSLRFNLNGSLFESNIESDLTESDINILKEDIQAEHIKKNTELKETKKRYRYYEEMLSVKALKKKNKEKMSAIAMQMYEMGYMNINDLIDEQTKKRNAIMEYFEIYNELGAMKYRMYKRSNIYSISFKK